MNTGDAARLPTSFVTSPAGGDLEFLEHEVRPRKGLPKLAWRWIKFNLVGGIGIGVQLAVLWILSHAMSCNYLIATAVAVEAAVLHNFLWHQSFTWADRNRGSWRDSWVRLLQFNLTIGLISIAGNLLLMGILVGTVHLRVLLANAISIAACSAANFASSELYVFRVRAVSPRRQRDTETTAATA